MEPFVLIEKDNILNELCDTILSIGENNNIIPLYPEESSIWFDIISELTEKLLLSVEKFMQKYSLNIYRMINIVQSPSLLQPNMEIITPIDNIYRNDLYLIENTHSTVSYIWCLSASCNIVFGKSYRVFIKKGDLVIFPASWEYPYKLDPSGIYLKGTLYTSYE